MTPDLPLTVGGSQFFCETVQAWTAVCQEAYAMASELKMDSGGRKEGRRGEWVIMQAGFSWVLWRFDFLLDFTLIISPISRTLSSMLVYFPNQSLYQFYCNILISVYFNIQRLHLSFFHLQNPRVSKKKTSKLRTVSLQESPQIQLTLEHEHCAELEGDVTTQDFEEASLRERLGRWWFFEFTVVTIEIGKDPSDVEEEILTWE